MQENFSNAEKNRIILPNGSELKWDAGKKEYGQQQPDLTTVERQDTLITDGQTTIARRDEKKVTTSEAAAQAEWNRTSEILAKKVRSFANWVFWGMIALLLKMIISVGDMFDEYAAKGVAKGIGEGIEVIIDVLIILIVFGMVSLFLLSLRKAKPQPESNAKPVNGTGEEILFEQQIKIKKHGASDTAAQEIVNR